jgi:hypothetical protein
MNVINKSISTTINKSISNAYPRIRPLCKTCVYYRLEQTPFETRETCKLYLFASTPEEPEIKYVETTYCRNNSSLCGPEAKYFKQR